MLDSVPWNTKVKKALSYWHDLVLNIYVFTIILITLYFINVTYDVDFLSSEVFNVSLLMMAI